MELINDGEKKIYEHIYSKRLLFSFSKLMYDDEMVDNDIINNSKANFVGRVKVLKHAMVYGRKTLHRFIITVMCKLMKYYIANQ